MYNLCTVHIPSYGNKGDLKALYDVVKVRTNCIV